MARYVISFLLICILGSTILSGCGKKKQNTSSYACKPSQVEVLSFDTITHVGTEDDSPSCKIALKLPFLSVVSDSASALVNQAILEKAFGPAYTHMSPTQFITAFADTLISYHRSDITEFMKEDVKRGMQPAAWYNYEFDLKAKLTSGLNDSIWNYTLTDFRQTGGAHPNTLKTCLNIEAATGRILTKRDVFTPDADQELTPYIIKELANYVNGSGKQSTQVPATLKGLQDVGIFLNTDPYIPENFLLEKESVTFYYNRYEIADYTSGDFIIKLPLSEAEKYFIKRK